MEEGLRVEGNEDVEDGLCVMEDDRQWDCRSLEKRNFVECLLFFSGQVPF